MTTPPTWPSCWPGWAQGQGGSRISEPQVSGHSGHAPWLPLHRLHSPSACSSAHLSRQPPCSRDTEIIAQNDLLHALHLCLPSTTTRALGPALEFLPLASERAFGHNRWHLVCGGGYPHPREESGFVFLLPPLCTCRSPGCSSLPPVPPSAPFLTSCC